LGKENICGRGTQRKASLCPAVVRKNVATKIKGSDREKKEKSKAAFPVGGRGDRYRARGKRDERGIEKKTASDGKGGKGSSPASAILG